MAIGDYQGRLLSRPVKVRWAGWETDTYRLQQNGWQLSAEQDVCYNRMRLVMRHEQIGMIGQTNDLDWDFQRALHAVPFEDGPEAFFQMRHMGRSILIQSHGPMDFSGFQPIDAKPSWTTSPVRELEDLVHFSAPLVRTKALILPEKTVDSLLAEILEMQEGAKMDYFRDAVAREGEKLPQARFHAQILSFPVAA
jgi:hypothetical protein